MGHLVAQGKCSPTTEKSLKRLALFYFTLSQGNYGVWGFKFHICLFLFLFL